MHTDGAKAYKHVGPMRWPVAGFLQEGFEAQPPFAQHKWAHTNVTHKKKPGVPVNYVAPRNVVLADGTPKRVWAGTEKVDGFWQYLRRTVTRTSVITGGEENTDARRYLAKLVRATQWRYWNLQANKFELFGKIVAEGRVEPGFVAEVDFEF